MATWILYHIFCLLSTRNFIFLKFFLIVCFLKTIICDSSVIIPLGVMLVNHKIQFFSIILFFYFVWGISLFLLQYDKILMWSQLEGAAHGTLSVWTVRGKAISEFRSPNAPPRAPTPLGTGTGVTSSMCNAVDFCLYAAGFVVERCAELASVCNGTHYGTLCRTGLGMRRYSLYNAVPSWSWYAAVLIMEHSVELVSVYYDTHHETLCRTAYFL